jgi:hypothetical protein
MNAPYAATPSAAELVGPFVDKLKGAILFPLIMLLMGVALLIFLWGVFTYITHAEGDEARQTGKRHMIFGIIGLVIMVSAYAILQVALNTFGITVPPTTP